MGAAVGKSTTTMALAWVGAAVGTVLLLQVERPLAKSIVVTKGRRQWQVRARMWVKS
jgi:hypothetical protein